MTEKTKALEAILKFVDDWSAKQAEFEQLDPDSYKSATKDDWILWFWETGGEL